MNKVKVRFGSRTEKSLKKSLLVNVVQRTFLKSSIACFSFGLLILFISEEAYTRYRDEVGYTIFNIWIGVSLILFCLSLVRKRKNNTSRNIALPVDVEGNFITNNKVLISPHNQSNVLFYNKLKLSLILLILMGFYSSVLVLQVNRNRESALFVYGFPFLILIFMFISTKVILPGLKTNIKILADINYLIALCILSPLSYHVYPLNRSWHVIVLFCSIAIVLILASISLHRFVSKQNYRYSSESTENEQTS